MKEKVWFIDQFEKGRIITDSVEVVCDPKIQRLCRFPYYNHPKGCPNWGKDGCPPNIPFFTDVYKSEIRIVAVWLDLKSYLTTKKLIHPDWNERELRNLRHWQNHMDSYLFSYVKEVLPREKEFIFNAEAMGVNLFETCKKGNIYLEKYPANKVYRVGLIVEKK